MTSPYFTTVNEAHIDSRFKTYLSELKDHLKSKFSAKENTLLNMILSNEVRNECLNDFLMYKFENDNRSLKYLLLREFDILCGLSRDNRESMIIFKVFADEYLTYMDGVDHNEFIIENGCAGIANTFPIKDDMIRFELASLMYSDIKDDEFYDSDGFTGSADITDYLKGSARRICSHESSGPECYGFGEIEPCPIVYEMAQPGFFEQSRQSQSLLIDSFIENIYNNEDLEKDSDSKKYMRNLASLWPVESMRARLMAGYSLDDVVRSGGQVIDLLLSKSDVPSGEIESTKQDIIKMAIIPFPSFFKSQFGDNYPDPSLLCFNCNDDTRLGHKNISIEPAISFSISGAGYGLATGSTRILSEYGDFGKACVLEMIKNKPLSSAAIEDITHRMPDQYALSADEIIISWLKSIEAVSQNPDERMSSRILRFAVMTMGDSKSDILSSGSKDVRDAYNLATLSIISHHDYNNVYKLSFKFKDSSERKSFVSKTLLSADQVNGEVIRAGNFTQDDFSGIWSKVSRDIRGLVLSNDLNV